MTDWLYDGDQFFVDEGDAEMYVGLDPIMWVSEPPEAAICHIEDERAGLRCAARSVLGRVSAWRSDR